MKKYELKGGARVGKMNATYPLATLKVEANRLELKAPLIGRLVFAPEDVVLIQAYQSVPVIGKGIKIIHRNPKYHKKVVVWTFTAPEEVLQSIEQTGFISNLPVLSAEDKLILEQQELTGFAIKKSIIRGVILTIILAIIIDMLREFLSDTNVVLYGMILSFGGLFISSILVRLSKSFQKLVFKEGYEMNDVTRMILLMITMFSFISLMNSIFSGAN